MKDKDDRNLSTTEQEQEIGFRFAIVHLLYVTTLLATSIALFEEYSLIWLPCVVVFWAVVFVAKLFNPTPDEIFVWLFLIATLVICLGLLPVQSVRSTSYRMACSNTVRQLCLANLNYESSYQQFPPAYQADANGKPMHSWRVLILPFIEQDAIHSAYDFSEPWNGPNNKKLVDQLRWTYDCPGQTFPATQTPYKLVTGKGTVFEGDKPMQLANIETTANTIAIIEDTANPVNWMEPKDLTVEEAVKLFDVANATEPHYIDESKFYRRRYYHRNVGMLDGSVQGVGYLKDPRQIIPYLMNKHPHKKQLHDLKFFFPKPEFEVLYSGYFLLALNIFLALLPCFWKRLQPNPAAFL